MRRHRIHPAPSLLLISILIACSAGTATAESTVWTNTSTTKICSPNYGSGGSAIAKDYIDRYGGLCTGTRIWSRNVSIKYNVRVVNETKGTVIACGSTVAKGDRLSFEFIPHKYTDISWSGVGYSNDTPYGDWIASAGPPSGSPHQCVAKDEVKAKIYAPFSVAPPTKSISGHGNLGCGSLGSNGIMKCTPATTGNNSVVFHFAATNGRFYGRIQTNNIPGAPKACVGSNSPMQTYLTQPRANQEDCAFYLSSRSQFSGCAFAKPTGNVYTLSVPARTISCPITVIEPPINNVPPAAPSVAGAPGACIVGAPHSLTMQAIDPDGDTVRYLIDWDADGRVDQFVPPSGYVNSGTLQTASRIYATPGTKTLRIRAEDSNGLLSPWTTTSPFQCAESETAALDEDGTIPEYRDPFRPRSSAADLSLRVTPSLVRPGATTKVNWSATGVESCTVSAPNGDFWDTTLSQPGGETSSPIVQETIFTLACTDATGAIRTKQASVRTVPAWRER